MPLNRIMGDFRQCYCGTHIIVTDDDERWEWQKGLVLHDCIFLHAKTREHEKPILGLDLDLLLFPEASALEVVQEEGTEELEL